MAMFHFQFEARPKRTNPRFGVSACAMVCCWIKRDTQEQALAVALGWIGDEDWTIIRTEFAGPITRETQLANGMQYFEQAEIDNEVFVFFTSPTNDWDGDLPVDGGG